eukprot:8843209-Pyramimonas_sp.AAC.1
MSLESRRVLHDPLWDPTPLATVAQLAATQGAARSRPLDLQRSHERGDTYAVGSHHGSSHIPIWVSVPPRLR